MQLTGYEVSRSGEPAVVVLGGNGVRTERRDAADAAGEPRWVQWRMKRLRSLGFPAPLANELAHDGQVDIHALLELIDRGCPPHLAARIVTPLDREPRP